MIAWYDGAWIDESEPALSVANRGFTLGDGLFETMLWDGAAVRRLQRHLTRLTQSAMALEMPAPPTHTIEAIVHELAARNALNGVRAAMRLTWTIEAGARGLVRANAASAQLVVTAAPSVLDTTPLTLATVGIRRNESAPSARHKTLSYMDNVMARIEAAALGANEAVQLNTRGNVAGCAAGNIFVVLDRRVCTPPVEDGALPGTMRARVLEQAPNIEVRSVSAGDLARADAVAVTNALQGVRIVAQCDGRALAIDDPAITALTRLEH